MKESDVIIKYERANTCLIIEVKKEGSVDTIIEFPTLFCFFRRD